MFERYHIPIKVVPGRAPPVPKFVISRATNCINCGKCEKACIYGVHKRNEQDPRKMEDPINHLCKNCFRCVADCPQRALTMAAGEEYRSLGRGVWTSLRLATMWSESETGKIPVFGAGYRGMFAGPNYDGMWTDMSEIVRPTRDGIHGREVISTSVDIGRKVLSLEFDQSNALRSDVPPLIDLPVPVVFDVTRLRSSNENLIIGCARAADHLGSLLFVHPEKVPSEVMAQAGSHIVPVYPVGTELDSIEIPLGTRMIEIEAGSSWKDDVKNFNKWFPGVVLALRVKAGKGVEDTVLDMVRSKVAVAHVDYDDQGSEEGQGDTRHAMESLRAIHKAMVSKGVRDKITVIAGGGIAAAEHVPKTIISGADAVVLESALEVALECRNCVTCSLGSCPVSLMGAAPDWIEGRVTNLVGAWRDQMLEMLGAMGIREVRRLRGEVGRAIYFDDLERDLLAALEGGAKNG